MTTSPDETIEVGTVEELSAQDVAETATPWVTIVWNDPINLMDYVTYVFMEYFGYAKSKAEKLMWHVHNDGRAVVSNGNRELMETHVEAMHGYGLWATCEKS